MEFISYHIMPLNINSLEEDIYTHTDVADKSNFRCVPAFGQHTSGLKMYKI